MGYESNMKRRQYIRFVSFPDSNEWVLLNEMWEKYGLYPIGREGKIKLSTALKVMKNNRTLSDEDTGHYGHDLFIRRSVFLRDDVNDAFTYYAKKLKERFPELFKSEPAEEPAEEPVGEIVSVEDNADSELAPIDEFAVKALEYFLHDWEVQVNTIVKRISYLTRGDGSGIQDILHYLHECIERDSGVKLARLAGDGTKISVIRKDVRLQYYFLREARFLALKNGIVYNEYI